jgi:hypothetical protein
MRVRISCINPLSSGAGNPLQGRRTGCPLKSRLIAKAVPMSGKSRITEMKYQLPTAFTAGPTTAPAEVI